MRLSIPLCLLYPSIAPPPLPSLLYLRVFLDSIIPLELQKYLLVCMCIQSKLDRLRTKLSMRSFCAGERLQGMKEEKSEKWRAVDTTKGTLSWGGERRAKAEVWDETEQIRVTVSNKGYDTFSTFTFSSSFPFLFVALFLPSFSPTLHLFLHLSPAFVFHADLKTGAKKKKERKECVHI